MKKCKGCGTLLQTVDLNRIGYTTSLEKDYCMRCFRLIHYGDTSKIAKEKIVNDNTLTLYERFKNKLFVLIIDSFDALVLDNDSLLDYYCSNKLLIVINKIDLLPYSVKDEKMEDIYLRIINKLNNINIVGCLLTWKNDQSFNKLFFNLLDDINIKELVFVGRVNAGKTTIINKLIGSNDLTVSMYPGTTSNINTIEYNGYRFIDTPGLIDKSSFINNLNKSLIKSIVPSSCIKPKIFQVYNKEAYFIEGLISIYIKPIKKCSLSLLIKNDLSIHRSKLEKAEDYYRLHINDYKLKLTPFSDNNFKINRDLSLYIKGLGFIRIIGACNATINLHKDVQIYRCGVKL